MEREPLLPRPRNTLNGLLIISLVVAAIGWIANYSVDAFVQAHGWSVLTDGKLHLACSGLGLGVVFVGPVWIYRQLIRRRKSKA